MNIFFKYIIVFLALGFFISSARADVTASWNAGGVVSGVPVDKWLLFCAPVNDPYPAPIVVDGASIRSLTFTQPDGVSKCKMQSRSTNNVFNQILDSVDSPEIIFLVTNGVRVDPSPNAPTLVIN